LKRKSSVNEYKIRILIPSFFFFNLSGAEGTDGKIMPNGQAFYQRDSFLGQPTPLLVSYSQLACNSEEP
jgi:hypothetical protein